MKNLLALVLLILSLSSCEKKLVLTPEMDSYSESPLPSPDPREVLNKTYWEVTEVGGRKDLPKDSKAYFYFDIEGKSFSGFSGCNNFMSSENIIWTGNKLIDTDVAHTKVSCELEANHFFPYLKSVNRFVIDGDYIILKRDQSKLFEMKRLHKTPDDVSDVILANQRKEDLAFNLLSYKESVTCPKADNTRNTLGGIEKNGYEINFTLTAVKKVTIEKITINGCELYLNPVDLNKFQEFNFDFYIVREFSKKFGVEDYSYPKVVNHKGSYQDMPHGKILIEYRKNNKGKLIEFNL